MINVIYESLIYMLSDVMTFCAQLWFSLLYEFMIVSDLNIDRVENFYIISILNADLELEGQVWRVHDFSQFWHIWHNE